MGMDNRGSISLVLATGLVLAMAGAGLFVYGQSAAEEERKTVENAVEVEVEIVTAEVQTHERTGAGSTQGETVHEPVVEYTYEHSGEQYRSSSVYPGGGTFQQYADRSDAEEKLSEYSEGEQTTGYVHPDEPSESFLVQKQSALPQALVFGGGLFVVIGTFVTLWGTIIQMRS